MSKVRVLNPIDNTDIFGVVPALTLTSKHKGVITTREAPIYLVEGKHIGPNSGFGVAHIWAEHQQEIIQAGFTNQSLVSAYVQKILTAPGVIYFEDRNLKKPRVNTVRIVTGTVILEYVRTIIDKVETPHWSVVTAYSNTRTVGVLVGQI
ncbi:hypothetical protein [Roseobacter sp. TSBP12]|uniref:hypothetical protein n=1 Tax=Roseobacter sp. TSBP12 TaxID=1236613 RepID=UPI00125F33F7|nr:hypothetical protein [Roseobacter sp. TSBP12]KAB6716663.1 hypothetical protein C8029_08370 [Roseobacter sp. TSBP12]